jgi:hypothetical protein
MIFLDGGVNKFTYCARACVERINHRAGDSEAQFEVFFFDRNSHSKPSLRFWLPRLVACA